jgi:hypothetical protein
LIDKTGFLETNFAAAVKKYDPHFRGMGIFFYKNKPTGLFLPAGSVLKITYPPDRETDRTILLYDRKKRSARYGNVMGAIARSLPRFRRDV